MLVELKRTYKGDNYTIGKLYLDGVYFCDTLEPVDRGLAKPISAEKVKSVKAAHTPGSTAIPTGSYTLTLDVLSPKYSSRPFYIEVCGGYVPRVMDTPGFDGVLFHTGNTFKDTAACILVGENRTVGSVIYSQDTFRRLYKKLKAAGQNHQLIICDATNRKSISQNFLMLSVMAGGALISLL